MSDRRGLSRIEVLIVLSILALTAALLLVGVTRVRQAADAIRCRNNLKQLGMAVHNYHSTTNHLPHLVDQGEGSPTGTGLPSVFHNLLPYIESRPILYRPGKSPPANYHAHSSIALPYGWKDGGTYTQSGGDVNEDYNPFLDPSDTTTERLRDVPMTLPDSTTGYYTTSSYAANGLLPWGIRTPISLEKGLGATILFAERPQVCRASTGDDVYNLWGVGFYSPHMPAFAILTPTELPGLESTGQIAPVLDQRMVRVGRQDAPPVAERVSPLQLIRNGQPCDPRLPGTPHRSGMQVVMGDGSVRVFGLNTDAWVFWTACVPTNE